MSKFLWASIESYSTNSALSHTLFFFPVSPSIHFLISVLLSYSPLSFLLALFFWSTNVFYHSMSSAFTKHVFVMSEVPYTSTSSAIVCAHPYLWGRGGSYQINRTHLNTGKFTRYTFSFKKKICSALPAPEFFLLFLPFLVLPAFPPFYLWGGHFSSVFSFLLVHLEWPFLLKGSVV